MNAQDVMFAELVIGGLTEAEVGTCPNCLRVSEDAGWRRSKANPFDRICPHCVRVFTNVRLRRFWGDRFFPSPWNFAMGRH